MHFFVTIKRQCKFLINIDFNQENTNTFRNNMLKLLYLSNSIIPSKNANSVHVMKMSQAFAKLDLDVTLLAPDINVDGYEGDVFDNYAVENIFRVQKLPYPKILPGRTKFWFFIIASVIFALKNKQSHVYGRNIGACCLIALFHKNIAVELHSPISKLGFFEKASLKVALMVNSRFSITVISSALKSILISEGISEKVVYVNHDGADLSEKVNEKSTNKFKVGYVGHLYQGRGIEVIIHAAKKLPDVLFEVVGGYEKDILSWNSKGVPKNLTFIGHVTPKNAEIFRLQCDVLLAPYQEKVSIAGKGDTSSYMSPLKIFEYMASGKTIISSDLPVLREVLNKENSILVKSDDLEGWVNAIQYLKNNPERSAELAMNSKKDFIRAYTWQERAKEIFKRLNRA
jgi:glycosyltransferase involved in cell wall biosynthesis